MNERIKLKPRYEQEYEDCTYDILSGDLVEEIKKTFKEPYEIKDDDIKDVYVFATFDDGLTHIFISFNDDLDLIYIGYLKGNVVNNITEIENIVNDWKNNF